MNTNQTGKNQPQKPSSGTDKSQTNSVDKNSARIIVPKK